jgi:hypothetical protein
MPPESDVISLRDIAIWLHVEVAADELSVVLVTSRGIPPVC